jgi:hypothetical protein
MRHDAVTIAIGIARDDCVTTNLGEGFATDFSRWRETS